MRSDARKRADHQPHWDPAVVDIIHRERAAAVNELRAALEALADEWAHPAEVYALRTVASARLRALLDEVAP